MNIDRALEAGLRLRALEDTVRSTLEHAAPTEEAGLTSERERELLGRLAIMRSR